MCITWAKCIYDRSGLGVWRGVPVHLLGDWGEFQRAAQAN